MLTKEEFDRYQKQIMLDDIGIIGQLKIKEAKVLVVGAGGLGSPVLQSLTAMGVGVIGVIDFDKIENSNLHRQMIYHQEDIGKSKVQTAIQKLSKQNTNTQFIAYNEMLTESNAAQILTEFDIIVDGCDNFLTRYIVNDTCVQLNKPLVYGSILGNEGQISLFNYKGSKNLRNLFPEPPNNEDVPNCSENGVLGTIPAIIGNLMAHEVIQVILAQPQLLDVLLIFNLKNYTTLKLNY